MTETLNHRKTWTEADVAYLVANVDDFYLETLAEDLGRTKAAVRAKLYTLNRQPKLREYALYKGDKLLAIGTAKDIAYEMGINPNSLYRYAMEFYAAELKTDNVRRLVKLD